MREIQTSINGKQLLTANVTQMVKLVYKLVENLCVVCVCVWGGGGGGGERGEIVSYQNFFLFLQSFKVFKSPYHQNS